MTREQISELLMINLGFQNNVIDYLVVAEKILEGFERNREEIVNQELVKRGLPELHELEKKFNE